MFDTREKIALFIDGANLYATSKSLGFDIAHVRTDQDYLIRKAILREPENFAITTQPPTPYLCVLPFYCHVLS